MMIGSESKFRKWAKIGTIYSLIWRQPKKITSAVLKKRSQKIELQKYKHQLEITKETLENFKNSPIRNFPQPQGQKRNVFYNQSRTSPIDLNSVKRKMLHAEADASHIVTLSQIQCLTSG